MAARILGFLWILPLLYAVWTAFHAPEFSTRSSLTAPLTLENWSVITAATLMSSGPRLAAFLLFQRQFVQSFMRAGIR